MLTFFWRMRGSPLIEETAVNVWGLDSMKSFETGSRFVEAQQHHNNSWRKVEQQKHKTLLCNVHIMIMHEHPISRFVEDRLHFSAGEVNVEFLTGER